MCRHNILAHNEQGYVVSCNGCGRYQLAFGTSLTMLDPADYDRFCRQVAGLAKYNQPGGETEYSKKIYLDLYCHQAMMVLSAKELKLLNALLDEAEFSRQVGFLLEESHIKSPEN
jgi:hypothetical protein